MILYLENGDDLVCANIILSTDSLPFLLQFCYHAIMCYHIITFKKVSKREEKGSHFRNETLIHIHRPKKSNAHFHRNQVAKVTQCCISNAQHEAQSAPLHFPAQRSTFLCF